MVERDDCRAAVGGTGAEKVGGNYGATLLATERCIQKGYHQSLWLDPKTRCNIEELSAMNFMAVKILAKVTNVRNLDAHEDEALQKV